ncbi:MAG: lactonase family protein [Pyrinomonadaceae bacterium]|nr:lactonase family protein [Phycisphaerales bacterium]
MFTRRHFLAVVAIFAFTGSALAEEAPAKLRVYFGTYTNKDVKGIYMSELDMKTGKLSEAVLAAETTSPAFLAIHPSKKYLYCVSEISNFDGKKTGAVGAFAIDPKTGLLTALNKVSSAGAGPCHLTVDKTGKSVLVANYGAGSVASLPIGEDGKLGEAASAIQHKGSSVDKGRQEAPHAHSINLDPANRFAFAADLGLDQVLIYKFDATKSTLTPNDPAFGAVAPGSGPRHFSFHPSGKFAYVCNEMTSGITAFSYDAEKGSLTSMQTLSTLPEPVKGNSTAECVVHPSGKFVYVSNRGHDSLAIFQIDQATGKLTAAGHQKTGGKTPRNFGIDPTGQFILAANQGSHDVHVFRVNWETGLLTATGSSIKVGSPVCVRFVAIE